MLTVRQAKKAQRQEMSKALVIGVFLGVLVICQTLQDEKSSHKKAHHPRVATSTSTSHKVSDETYTIIVGGSRGPNATESQMVAYEKQMMSQTPEWLLAKVKKKSSKPDIFSVLASK